MPAGGTVIFSAHGVSQAVRREAAERGLQVFDATCPLVTKVHAEVARMREHGREVVMIGHQGHPEAEGTMGQSEAGMYLVESEADVAKLAVKDPANLAYVTQTTLSMDDAARIVAALRARFPAILGPKKDDICYATQNRQDAVKFMAPRCDVVIVVGSHQQLELEPPARGGREPRPARLPRRPRRGDPRRMDRGSAHHRRDGGRLGAGGAGPGRDREPCSASGAARVRELEGITECGDLPAAARDRAARERRRPRLRPRAGAACASALRRRLVGRASAGVYAASGLARRTAPSRRRHFHPESGGALLHAVGVPHHLGLGQVSRAVRRRCCGS